MRAPKNKKPLPTYSEFNEARRLKRQSKQAEFHARCMRMAEQLGDTMPVKADDDFMITVRCALAAGEINFYNVVCDTCGTQLVNPSPRLQLNSEPPKKHICCPGCGWRSTVNA